MSVRPDPYAALRISDFRFFVSARFCVTLAIQIQSIVVGFQVWKLTGSTLSLGLIGLAEALPSICVSLYAGHVADVMSRKKIIVCCIAVLALCSASLLYFTTPIGSTLIAGHIFPIFIVIFISGIARGFITPALFAFMPQLIPRDLYANAVTWNSTFWETASIAGLALGGLIYGFFDITTAYSVDVTLTLVGLTLAAFVGSRPVPPATEAEQMWEKIKSGLRFVFQNKLILSAISLDLFAVLFGGAVALLPVFAEKILFVGQMGLGFLRAAPSVGALLMAFYITHHPIRKHTGRILFGAVAGFGICIILFAMSTNFWISMFILMLSGSFDCISVIIRSTLLQTLTPENMKGRVSAVNNIFIGSSNEIGMFESGATAEIMGTRPAVILGGCLTLVVVATTSLVSKSLRTLQRVH
jgi:MFS family permease